MSQLSAPATPETRPRQGLWNMLGLWALYKREVMRFFKMYMQTFVAPAVTALLFLAIFQLAFEGEGQSMGDVPFAEFLVPGLTIMAVMTSCFANASFTLMFEKIVQTIVDTLMPPLTAWEMTVGYVLSSITRGVLVGAVLAGAMSLFVDINIHHLGYVFFHVAMAAWMMSCFGLMTALWADKVDHVASVNNFVILPLTFLSGTFYSIQHLPASVQLIAQVNPFFYIIDGFRYGFIGEADSNLAAGIIFLLLLNGAATAFCRHLFQTGYNLKS